MPGMKRILLVILSCALYANFLPLTVILCFLLAPIPNIVAKRIAGSDGLSGDSRGVLEAGYFVTSFFIISGSALPIVLAHAEKINQAAMILSFIGGLLVYSTILGYVAFFIEPIEDTYF
ncbi:hypothetical protein SmJEL517_g05989 [Synchytrium microbalum]|uniref:Vacuolar protein sorting 55 n=1 Tax=Synchytrium microbalum TaxID=1806994 RepID=A0A507BSY5_9FUNG|nr:uncharacterized protein SmJEL517_g05989 [Synchytrium microbalum]TPX30431.1 hypothetical protein SmJEL517_g05989 [Synchytrium microbalum]